MKSLYQQFEDFVRQQPPEREYDFWDYHNCPIAQFGEHIGLIDEDQNIGASLRLCELHGRFDEDCTLISRPWTFGALAERIAARQALVPVRRGIAA